MKLKEKNIAIELRKKGNTYSEIIKIIPNVTKSTLSNWLKDLKLNQKEQKLLKAKTIKNGNLSRLLGSLTNRKKGIANKINAEKYAKKIFKKWKNNNLFIGGLVLYWCEGSKTNKGEVSLINTDFAAHKLFILWLQKYFDISKNKLKARVFIHKPYEKDQNWNQLWSKLIQLPVKQFYAPTIKPTPHIIKIKPAHQGCLRVCLCSTKIHYAIKYLIEQYKQSLHS